MKPCTLVRKVSLALLLTFAVFPAIPGEAAPPRKPAGTEIPFSCFLQVWDGPFKVISSRYDRASNRVIWNLQARKDGRLAAYEAFVADPDGVEVDTIKVKFTPAGPKVKAGAPLQAILSLGSTAGEPAKITIRERR